MPTIYNVIAGDTFVSISRASYGTEQEAGRIKRSNAGVSEPLTAGTVLVIPDIPGAPVDTPAAAPAAGGDEVSIRVAGQRFRFWENIRIVRSLDSIGTIEFSAPMDYTANEFRPFSYKSVTATIGGAPFFTGTMVSIVPTVTPQSKSIAVAGYATAGVLNDCTPPASAFPLEFNNQDLRVISENIAGLFGVGVDFRDDPGPVFDRVACDAGKKALPFLVNLAQQRGLIISSSASGGLVFRRSVDTGAPVARLEQGRTPLLSVTPRFNEQEYYSHITGIEPVIAGLKGGQFTAQNTALNGVIRPFTFSVPDVVGADIQTAVNAKMGRMFGGAASYEIGLDTWRDPGGAIWAPNTTIKLAAPDAMIYNEYEFLIRRVELLADSDSRVAKLQLVLPGAFSGEIPGGLPWD